MSSTVANPSPRRRLRFTRRGMAVLCAMGATTLLLITAVLIAWPTRTKVDSPGWITAGRVDDFGVNQPVQFREHRFWLVRLESGEFTALLGRDPHSTRSVSWLPDLVFAGIGGWFRDPCLGSTYQVNGRVAFGPSPRGLDRYEVRIEGDAVRVSIKTVIRGSGTPSPISPTPNVIPEVR